MLRQGVLPKDSCANALLLDGGGPILRILRLRAAAFRAALRSGRQMAFILSLHTFTPLREPTASLYTHWAAGNTDFWPADGNGFCRLLLRPGRRDQAAENPA